ncbi:MAG: EAL domain-containing protein [Erysipelothrix sp.]|nr:EAL domain-containing protein [Erysipelothrix sp.]
MQHDAKSLVNTQKLFLVPIAIVFIIIIILGFFSMSYSHSILKEKMMSDGIIIAQQFADKIESSRIAAKIVKDNYDVRASEIGAYVLKNKNIINNEFLKGLRGIFEIDEIYYYTSDGTLIYSATETFIGWQAKEGDPIFNFMQSDLTSFHEEIRKGTDNDEWYKFSYFKDPDGSFVQVGYYLENYLLDMKDFELQTIIENEFEKSSVFYILVTDINLMSIADTDREDIGVDWSDEEEYKIALAGKPVAYEWFYPKRNETIFEVAVPIYEDDNIVGILAYGSSLSPIRNELNNNLLRISLVLILTGILLTLSQRQLILVPLQNLRRNLKKFSKDDDVIDKLPADPKDPFLGVVESFNSTIDTINLHVSEINRVNFELDHAANYDFVTGIKNRRALMEFVWSISLHDEQLAFCMLDLNGLKDINDIYGHNVGDVYIQTIALRLLEYSEIFDSFRFGGDEFFLIIKASGTKLKDILDDLVERLSAPILHNSETLRVRFCIGVSQSIVDGTDADELIRKADIAMYHLKNQSQDGYLFYIEGFNETIQFKEYVYKELIIAIETNDFQLLYQPIIETLSQEVISLEALIRLKNIPILPSVFIPIAETRGLIGKITFNVIDQVLNQLVLWKKLGFDLVPVSINISPRLFVLDSLFDFITSRLEQFGIDSHYLELEITEEVLINNKDTVLEYLSKYREIGIRVSLDDFGSGYSSLNYLTHIPFDKIKLDKTIIDKYLNEDHHKIIESIIDIVHELGIPIVAEGVEFQEQYELLSQYSCDQIQGYLFSKPVEPILIEQKYLKRKK